MRVYIGHPGMYMWMLTHITRRYIVVVIWDTCIWKHTLHYPGADLKVYVLVVGKLFNCHHSHI